MVVVAGILVNALNSLNAKRTLYRPRNDPKTGAPAVKPSTYWNRTQQQIWT